MKDESVRELYSVASAILAMLKEGEKIDYEWIEQLGDALFTIEEETGWADEFQDAMARAVPQA